MYGCLRVRLDGIDYLFKEQNIAQLWKDVQVQSARPLLGRALRKHPRKELIPQPLFFKPALFPFDLPDSQRLEDGLVVPREMAPTQAAFVFDGDQQSLCDPNHLWEDPFAGRVDMLEDRHGKNHIEGPIGKGLDDLLHRSAMDSDLRGHFWKRFAKERHGVFADFYGLKVPVPCLKKVAQIPARIAADFEDPGIRLGQSLQ